MHALGVSLGGWSCQLELRGETSVAAVREGRPSNRARLHVVGGRVDRTPIVTAEQKPVGRSGIASVDHSCTF